MREEEKKEKEKRNKIQRKRWR